jgi:hypothetical protein
LEGCPELEELPFGTVPALSREEVSDFFTRVPTVEVDVISAHVEGIRVKDTKKISVQFP